MHTLGQRLKKSEYRLIFHEQDKDGSGTIDLVSIASPFLSLVFCIHIVSLSIAHARPSLSLSGSLSKKRIDFSNPFLRAVGRILGHG